MKQVVSTTSESAETAPRSETLPYADASTPHPTHIGGGEGVTRHDVATLALKLLGIYMLLRAFPAAGYVGTYVFYAGTRIGGFPSTFVLYEIALLAFYAGIGALLLAYGRRVAGRLLPAPPPGAAPPPVPMSVDDLQAGAFAVVGLVLITVLALPGFIYGGWKWYCGEKPADAAERFEELKPTLARHAAELLLGLWLFYGSKRLASYWHRIRAGRTISGADDGPL